jgi:hypothetical protein
MPPYLLVLYQNCWRFAFPHLNLVILDWDCAQLLFNCRPNSQSEGKQGEQRELGQQRKLGKQRELVSQQMTNDE